MTSTAKIIWEQREVALTEIKPNERNPRTITAQQYEKLKQSLTETGYHARLLCDREMNLLGGHMRLKVMADLGVERALVLVPSRKLTKKEAQRISVQDNVSFGEWEMEILGTDFSVEELTGWGVDENILLFAPETGSTSANDPDLLPEPPKTQITLYGEVWSLGGHRLMCGNSTLSPDVEKLLAGAKPHLMVTDPPYGVEYDASWRNEADRANGKPYGARAIGRVENDDRADWREAWALFPGEVAYVWHADKNAHIVAESLIKCGFEIRAQIIWAKSNMVISRGHYHPKHEPCWYAVRKKAGATGHWQGDRKQTTLWEIDKPQKSETGHSTQKPIECMRRPIENNSAEGDMVYEPFSGSGTTIIAATMTGRKCFAMEVNPSYVDMAIMRWQQFTGEDAVNAETGEKFNDRLSISQARQADAGGVEAGA